MPAISVGLRGLILGLSVLPIIACSPEETGPEAAILANIKAIAQAVENKDTGEVLDYVTEQFLGNDRLDKRELQGLMLAYYLRHKKINVVVTRMDIEVSEYDPYSAKMRGSVLLTGTDRLLPENGRLINVSGEWQKYGDDWLLARLDWQ
ncbi:MAG TPA: hypothetical protein VF268_03875 [Gammaproteobacteria bacterium]|jgi:hypothetical protein